MKMLIATCNPKKLGEMQRILSPVGIETVSLADLNIPFDDVEETGESFKENALIKAEAGMRKSGMPCIADDSGLQVDALGGEPGVYSARYAGGHGDDGENIKKLLGKLEGIPMPRRTARFICSVCCVFPSGDKLFVQETCEGFISLEMSGENGFGYDPVFLFGGRTFASFTPEEKDKISHRGKALRKFKNELLKRMENDIN